MWPKIWESFCFCPKSGPENTTNGTFSPLGAVLVEIVGRFESAWNVAACFVGLRQTRHLKTARAGLAGRM